VLWWSSRQTRPQIDQDVLDPLSLKTQPAQDKVYSFVGWNPCPEGVVLSEVEGRGSDNMSRTQGSRHGTLVSNLRVGTRKGVPDLRD
jgi:hypothetical protein